LTACRYCQLPGTRTTDSQSLWSVGRPSPQPTQREVWDKYEKTDETHSHDGYPVRVLAAPTSSNIRVDRLIWLFPWPLRDFRIQWRDRIVCCCLGQNARQSLHVGFESVRQRIPAQNTHFGKAFLLQIRNNTLAK
jgi:hypothetical protein